MALETKRLCAEKSRRISAEDLKILPTNHFHSIAGLQPENIEARFDT